LLLKDSRAAECDIVKITIGEAWLSYLYLHADKIGPVGFQVYILL